MIICDDLCAVIVDDVVPAVLVVGCVDCVAVNAVSFACLCDLSSCVTDIFPCPVICRIVYAVLVEDSLVVQKSDCVMVLRKSILRTVVITVVQFDDAFIELGHVNCVIICNIIVEVEEQVVLHVHLSCVGVHPEDIRHLAAGSACLEECPVVVPVNDVDLDFDAGLC